MNKRNSLTIFITLVCLTFFIFFSSITLSDYIALEEKVDAETTKTIENPSISFNHSIKSTKIEYKEVGTENKRFSSTRNSPYVFLTFDDGPTEHTKEILAILNQYNIQSTFFMLHGNIVRRPEMVKATYEAGHAVGCHGVTHRIKEFYGTELSPVNEMDTCSNAIEQFINDEVVLVRVPYGSYPHLTDPQKAHLEKSHYILWDWNVDSIDWNQRSSTQMVEIVIKQVKVLKERGTVPVILLHDTNMTVQSLPEIIEELQKLGYQFKEITPEDKPLQFKPKQ